MKGTIYLHGPFKSELHKATATLQSRLHIWREADERREFELVLFIDRDEVTTQSQDDLVKSFKAAIFK